MDRFGDKVNCNPTVKLTKGERYPLIDIEKINPGRKSVCSDELVEYVGQSGSKFNDNDVLMARITPCLENGKLAIARTDGKSGTGSTELFVFRGIEGVTDTDYIYYLLSMPHMRQLAANSMTGASGRQRADLGFIKRIQWDFPDIKKQKEIVEKLSTYDSLIELNNKRIKLLTQMAENLYKEWFVRFRFPGHETAEFENGIPKGWEYKKLFDIAKVTYGYSFSSDLFCDDESLSPVVRIRDVPNNETKTFTSEPCNDKYRITENAILVGMDGIFHMCMWNGSKAYLNQRVVEIESKDNAYSNLMLFYAIYPQVKFWEQTIAGTTVAHLGDKHLKKMVVVVPDKSLKCKATELFNNMMAEKASLMKQNRNLIKQRDLLLPRLMSGKLEV